MSHDRFNEAFLKSIDYAFNVLGKSGNKTLFFHLENTFQIKKEDIPNRIQHFDQALREVFGSSAVILEKISLMKLCDELNLKFEENNMLNYVEAVNRITNALTYEPTFLPNFTEETITS